MQLFLYTVSWRYKRDNLHTSIDMLFYIMFYNINTMKEYQTLLHHAYQKRSRFEPGAPQSIICSCAPEYQYFLIWF